MKTIALIALLSIASPKIHELELAVVPTSSAAAEPEPITDAELDAAITAGEIAVEERDSCREELAARPTVIVERSPSWVPWVIAGTAIAGAILGALGTIAAVDAASPDR